MIPPPTISSGSGCSPRIVTAWMRREDRHEVADHRGHTRAEAETHGPVEEHEGDDRREHDEVRDIESRGQTAMRGDVGITMFEEAERKDIAAPARQATAVTPSGDPCRVVIEPTTA